MGGEVTSRGGGRARAKAQGDTRKASLGTECKRLLSRTGEQLSHTAFYLVVTWEVLSQLLKMIRFSI